MRVSDCDCDAWECKARQGKDEAQHVPVQVTSLFTVLIRVIVVAVVGWTSHDDDMSQ